MAIKAVEIQTRCDHHLAFESCDLAGFSKNTPCKRCQNRSKNWFCLSCKDVFCGHIVNGHSLEHFQQTKHCVAVNCSNRAVWCYSCLELLDARVIQQWRPKDRSSSPKLENIDAMIVDDELALAKEGLRKIFDRGLKSLADPKAQQEFLLYSATLLSADSCSSELKVNLSTFRCNLSEETSSFIKAQDELKAASDLSSLITRNKFVLQQQTSKYDEVKKEIVASDERIADFKAMIKELEACLSTEESKRAKIDEVIDSIEAQVTTARDGLVSDLTQISSMEGTIQAANQLVAQQQSAWDNLKTTFTKFT